VLLAGLEREGFVHLVPAVTDTEGCPCGRLLGRSAAVALLAVLRCPASSIVLFGGLGLGASGALGIGLGHVSSWVGRCCFLGSPLKLLCT